MRRRVPLALVGALLLAAASTGAARDLRALRPPPQLPACRDTAHPRLPPHWRGTYLMAPFTSGQLVIAEIVRDAPLAATRITLHGVKHGTADFLVTGNTTYALTSEGGTVTGCHDLGDTGWRPLPDDWLAARSECAGSAPLLATPVDWWKTPIDPAPSTYWIWYRRSDGTPFRLVFEWPSDRLAPFGRFALSYELGAAPIERTGLSNLAGICKKAAPSPPSGGGAGALAKRLDAMDRSAARADAALQRLVPALRLSCPAPAELRWPQRLAITGLLTPFDATENPAPTEVLYDWTVPGQRTRVVLPRPTGVTAQDALLLPEGGYTVTHRQNGAPSCSPGLPGTLRPDWPRRAPCTCEAALAAGTPLTPDDPVRILSCPLAPPRIAWAWYRPSGRPSMFMVTSRPADVGARDFAVLDYLGWTPLREVPQSAFKKPPQCMASSPGSTPRAPGHCATCHAAKSTN